MAKTICTAISPQADSTINALRDGAGLTTREIIELAVNGLSEIDPADARRQYNILRSARGNRNAPARHKKSAKAPKAERNDLGLGDDVGENPFAEE